MSRVRAAGSAHENREPTICSRLIILGQAVEGAGAYPACAPMFARVTTFQGAPDSVDGPIRFAVKTVSQGVKELSGFLALSDLSDRTSGRAVIVTLPRKRAPQARTLLEKRPRKSLKRAPSK